MNLRNLLVLLAALIVSSCSTVSGPKYSETPALISPDQATVVVYRWSSLKGMAWQHPIHVDGKHVADVGSGNFTRFLVSPGTHRVGVGPKASKLAVDLTTVAGVTYFIEDHPGANLYAPDRFFVVDPAVGEKSVGGYSYQPAFSP
jgi:hypothetical protein